MAAYGQTIRKINDDTYRIEWTIDRKYRGSRLRFPTSYSKVTDRAGAARFQKKHKLEGSDPL